MPSNLESFARTLESPLEVQLTITKPDLFSKVIDMSLIFLVYCSHPCAKQGCNDEETEFTIATNGANSTNKIKGEAGCIRRNGKPGHFWIINRRINKQANSKQTKKKYNKYNASMHASRQTNEQTNKQKNNKYKNKTSIIENRVHQWVQSHANNC